MVNMDTLAIADGLPAKAALPTITFKHGGLEGRTNATTHRSFHHTIELPSEPTLELPLAYLLRHAADVLAGTPLHTGNLGMAHTPFNEALHSLVFLHVDDDAWGDNLRSHSPKIPHPSIVVNSCS